MRGTTLLPAYADTSLRLNAAHVTPFRGKLTGSNAAQPHFPCTSRKALSISTLLHHVLFIAYLQRQLYAF